MTKRDAPDSGFAPGLPSKRHGSDHSSANLSQPLNGHSDLHPHEDDFVPDMNLTHASAQDEDLLLDNSQRNELAREASNLQHKPSPATHLESQVVSLIDDADLDSQPDDTPPEQSPTPSPAPTDTTHRERRSRKKKRHRHQPLLWKDETPDEEAMYIARKAHSLICGTTNITLDPEPLLFHGTLWKHVLLDELPDLIRSGEPLPLPPEQQQFDFLKACFRLGSFIEPSHMSRLLGGGYKSSDYCGFLLQGFLGLSKNPKVRRLLGGEEQPHEKHGDVVVYADQLYPSDDEILIDQQDASAHSEEEPIPQHAQVDVAVIEESDREEDENHRDPPHVSRSAVHEIGHKLTAEQRFLTKPSYVLRNYMSIVTGQQIDDIDDFANCCKNVGATFLEDPSRQPLSRLKWLRDNMPAPELGKGKGVSEPLALWKHAIKTYSVKNLSRCALIRVDPLLDWLCYVAKEIDPATSEAEYFRVKRPVVAIAPVALLYLSDRAADYALRILSIAVQTEELNPPTEENCTDYFVIEGDDVTSAALYMERESNQRRRSYVSTNTNVLGGEHAYNNQWPGLVQRPLTSSEHIELCDRTPRAFVAIPNSITDEMRAVLMSFRQYVRGKLYVNNKIFSRSDPMQYMSAEERNESRKERRRRNIGSGIRWNQKGVNEEAADAEDDSDGEDSPARSGKQMAERLPVKEDIPSEEGNRSSVPVDKQVVGVKDINAPVKTNKQRGEKLPEFFDQVNVAELVACQLGIDELKKRKQKALQQVNLIHENELQTSRSDAAQFLKESASEKLQTVSTVCIHRLGWICLRALGIEIDSGADDAHPMGYASSANYTNFGQFRSQKPVVLTTSALHALAQITDAVVRDEAEILMACAAHDDGRPWIDRADVALVTSVRKEDFHYRDV